jgi:ETC complex I subunit conserved region
MSHATRQIEAMVARIYRPAKTAMQSGLARTKQWILEYEPESPRQIEPLMGWTSSIDMRKQVKIAFDTKDEAVAYAERNGIQYRIFDWNEPKTRKVAYSDNFRFGRMGPWTH